MGKYLVMRLVLMIPILLGITIVSFTVMKVAPGDPVSLYTDFNPNMNAETIKRLRETYGLDDPMYVQYWRWLSNMVRLDFGTSFASDHRPVLNKILERLPITIMLNVISLVVIFCIAIPLGVLSAVHQDSLFDKVTTLFVFLGISIPTFWLALLLMILFGVQLEWLPISGLRSFNYKELSAAGQFLDLTKHLILPVFVSAFGGLAGISRYMRSEYAGGHSAGLHNHRQGQGLGRTDGNLQACLQECALAGHHDLGTFGAGPYRRRRNLRDDLRDPGMGQLFYQSVMMRDYPTIMGILVIGAVLTLLGNLLADVSYSFADPRIRVTD